MRVSGLLQAPKDARACYVLAHGAGAGMNHAFMAAVAAELAERGIATLRYQFPYMEKGGKRPDPPKLAHATVRAAVAEAARLLPKLPLFAGGKSFGGRMTSQAQAARRCPACADWRSSDFRCIRPEARRRSAASICSMCRSRCCSCKARAISSRCSIRSSRCAKRSAQRATLAIFQDADHSFHVPARTGRKDAEVRAEVLDTGSPPGSTSDAIATPNSAAAILPSRTPSIRTARSGKLIGSCRAAPTRAPVAARPLFRERCHVWPV